MSTHQFIVTVVVDGEPAEDTRDYALTALSQASLPDVRQLEGFDPGLKWTADLEVQAEL